MSLDVLPSSSLLNHLGPWRAAGSGPAYRQLADRLRLLVLDGRLPLGARLPGERELARALGVSRTTSSAAYATLRDQGLIESRPGSGVRTRLPANRPVAGFGLSSANHDDEVIDLATASLPAGEAVHHAYSKALERLPVYLPTRGYETSGLEMLRTVIALRYERRGLSTTPDQIMVTSGALHGFALLLRALTRPGDRVIIDHPTFPRAIDAIERASCTAIPVSLPSNGWDVGGLAAAMRQTGPRLAYLVPDFHNPTGRCMDAQSRAQLAELARHTRATLIFDEVLTDLGLDMEVPPPNAPAESDVVRLGSIGKSHWGGLRIGWIRAEAPLIHALAAARTSIDLGTPTLEQLAAATLLETDAPLVERRTLLRERRDLVLKLLAERLPTWKAEMPRGGMSVWVELPEPVSTALAVTAERFGLKLAPGPRFGIGGAFERFIRVPFTQSAATLDLSISRLARAYERAEPAGRAQAVADLLVV